MAEDVCYNCFSDCRSFALHPSELLYLAFYIIDTLRGCEPHRAQKFADRCYNDNITYLRHDKQTGASDDDLHTAVTATLHTAVQWMLDSRQGGMETGGELAGATNSHAARRRTGGAGTRLRGKPARRRRAPAPAVHARIHAGHDARVASHRRPARRAECRRPCH